MFLAWSGGLFGLVFGGTLLLVDDGVPLEMALGGFEAGLVADFALSGVIVTCPFTI